MIFAKKKKQTNLKTLPCLEEMSDKELCLFFASIERMEAKSNWILWCKAIRCTLIALGYNEWFINDEFRNKLDSYYCALYEGDDF